MIKTKYFFFERGSTIATSGPLKLPRVKTCRKLARSVKLPPKKRACASDGSPANSPHNLKMKLPLRMLLICS